MSSFFSSPKGERGNKGRAIYRAVGSQVTYATLCGPYRIRSTPFAREALLHASTSPRVETSSGNCSSWWLSAEAIVGSRRSACSAVVAVLWCWARDAYEASYKASYKASYNASPPTSPGASLPPLEAPALLPMEAYQGKLGYENHPMYDYLARSQARNWPY